MFCRCGTAEWHIFRGDLECSDCHFRVENFVDAIFAEGIKKTIRFAPKEVGSIILYEERGTK